MAKTAPIDKITEAARRSCRETLTAISNDLDVPYRTIMRWKSTDYWQEAYDREIERQMQNEEWQSGYQDRQLKAAIRLEQETIAREALGTQIDTIVKETPRVDTIATETPGTPQVVKEAPGTPQISTKEQSGEKIKYRDDLVRSREILRRTLDEQMALSGKFAIVASNATNLMTQKNDPIEACSTIAKSGIAQTAQASAQVSRSAMDLLNRIYAIDKILDYLDKQQLGV